MYVFIFLVHLGDWMATYWKVAAHSAYYMFSWYKYLIVDLVFPTARFLEWEFLSDCACSWPLPTCTFLDNSLQVCRPKQPRRKIYLWKRADIYMSRHMGKPTICLGENKGADQLRSNCEADQRLCFRYSDSTVPLLLKSEISSFYLFSVTVQVGWCRTWLETTLLVFPRGGSYI